jgi:DNA repair exonuclease SbcCD ATPase subunit
MTGGWTGSSGSHARAWWANKQRHDQAAQQLAACKQQLAACKQQLAAADKQTQVLLQQQSSAEAALAAAQQRQQLLLEVQEAQAEAAAARAALEQEQLLLAEHQVRSTDMQKRLQQYQAALGGSEVGGGTGQAKGKGKGSKGCKRSDAEMLQEQLQADVDKAAADVAAAEQQLEDAQGKVGAWRYGWLPVVKLSTSSCIVIAVCKARQRYQQGNTRKVLL